MPLPPSSLLIAKWSPDLCYGVDAPNTLRWDDLRPATREDFHAHKEDTHSEWEMPEGTILLIYPSIIAEVRFDLSLGCWLVHGVCTEPMVLDVEDPEADDAEVLAHCQSELFHYRVRIVR